MDDIEYTSPAYGSVAELRRLAEIHLSAPANWNPDYQFDESQVANWVRFVEKSKDDASIKIIVARHRTEIVGMHWVVLMESEGRRRARIDSLWVCDDMRRHGIGSRLKALGEEWARANGAVSISTHVFYANKKMIEFNLKLGFEAKQLEMVKELKE